MRLLKFSSKCPARILLQISVGSGSNSGCGQIRSFHDRRFFTKVPASQKQRPFIDIFLLLLLYCSAPSHSDNSDSVNVTKGMRKLNLEKYLCCELNFMCKIQMHFRGFL